MPSASALVSCLRRHRSPVSTAPAPLWSSSPGGRGRPAAPPTAATTTSSPFSSSFWWEAVRTSPRIRRLPPPDRDDRGSRGRSRRRGASTPWTLCVEYGLAWFPHGPATYAAAMFLLVAAAEAGAMVTSAPRPPAVPRGRPLRPTEPPATTTTTTSMSTSDPIPGIVTVDAAKCREEDEASGTSSSDPSTLPTSEEGDRSAGGRGGDGGGTGNGSSVVEGRHRRCGSGRTPRLVWVLLMHPEAGAFELLSVRRAETAATVNEFVVGVGVGGQETRTPLGDVVDAALRDATLPCWAGTTSESPTATGTSEGEPSARTGGGSRCCGYSSCLRLRLRMGVQTSSARSRSPSTTIQARALARRRKNGGAASSPRAARWSLESSTSHRLRPNEVLVPIPEGQSASRTLRRARTILAQSSDVLASAKAPWPDEKYLVASNTFGPAPKTELDRDATSKRSVRATPLPSPSPIRRTPLGARPAAHAQEAKRVGASRNRRSASCADPLDKENGRNAALESLR